MMYHPRRWVPRYEEETKPEEGRQASDGNSYIQVLYFFDIIISTAVEHCKNPLPPAY